MQEDQSSISLFQFSGLAVKIHPIALMQVFQAYTRNVNSTFSQVSGTLLGHIHQNTIEVTNSFHTPHQQDTNEDEPVEPTRVVVNPEMTQHQSLLRYNKLIYPTESVVGCYVTDSPFVQDDIATLLEAYKNKAKSLFVPTLSMLHPIILVLDPSFRTGNFNLRVIHLQ